MNFKTLFFIFFIGLFGLTTTSYAQGDIEVLQGQVKGFHNFYSEQKPEIKSFPVIGNELDFVDNGNNDWSVYYTPAPDFLGYDGFIIETYEVFDPTNPANSEMIPFEFPLIVVESMITTNNDFVHLTSQEDITIDPLANDDATSTDLTVSIAQALKGTATVNEDQTITYTPVEGERDYIIYTVSDEFNTVSSATIYLSHEEEVTQDLEVDVVIASGNSEYIILPSNDFTLNANEYDFGSVEQINDFVFEYSANTNIEGEDVVTFTDGNGNAYQANVIIIEKYTDEGFVRDDVFHSASNTKTEFDVTTNDISSQYVISDHSVELIHEGAGVFSYTPNPYFSGVKTFFYTADNGFEEQTGTITLVINNYKPTNYFEYNLTTPQDQPRIIEYDVPIGTEFFEVASLPLHGSIEIFTEDESVDVGCEEGLQKVFAVYTPDTDYVGSDNVTIRYCASDNNLCNDVSISLDVVASDLEDCICIDDCVWPGDANGDGKVSVVDALAIGRYIGQGGAARESSPFGDMYEGSSADNWLLEQANGKNIKHADADGDGLISTADLDVVIDNYGDINSIISADVLGIKNLPFLLTTDQTDVDSGEVMVINVIIGTEENPAIDIHGVTFAVNLPASLVDSSSVEVEYLESKYLVKDAPYVSLTHQPYDGIIHTAGAKSNSIGSTGSGIVATVSFIVEENAEGIKDNDKRASSDVVGDIIATIKATDIIIEDSKGFKYALPNTSLDVVVNSGVDNPAETTPELLAFPNPASDFVRIETEDGGMLNSLNVYSLDGRLIASKNQINSNKVKIQTNTFESGLYIVKAKSDTHIYSTRLIKN